MTTKTIDCVECGESVSYGRLSCPACGALLASVAGGRPRPARPTPEATAVDGQGSDVAEVSVTSADPAPTAAAVLILAAPTSDIPPNQIELPLDTAPRAAAEAAPQPVKRTRAKAQAGRVAPAVADHASAESWDAPEVRPEAEPEATDQAAGPAEPGELQPAAFSLSPEPGAALPSPVRTPFDGPEPILVARSYGHRVDVMAGYEAGRPPSAYRAPSLVLSTATAAGPNWPSSTSMTVGAGASIAATDAADPEPATDTAERTQATRIAEIGTWFVIVGAAMSVLGFLLPWSRVVIGSRSLGGYLDNWGLASPTHVIVLLATLAILGLGILRTTVPVWLWAGIFALTLGGVLLGLTWPYQIGPLGADVGVIVVALGGLALVIGGVVTSWATRHVEVEPAV